MIRLVTLNITVSTETRIYQSSDFRLSTSDGPLDFPAMKMAHLSYPSFEALVCFTGLAKERADSIKDTMDYIVEWLAATQDSKLFQVVELIRKCASDYVATVEQNSGRRELLTIVIAAFMGRRVQVAVISNFQNTLGRLPYAPLPELQTSWASLRPGDSPIILVTGNAKTVTSQDLDSLMQTIAEAGEDSARIRLAISDLSRSASRHPSANQTISSECTVASMDSSGSGMQDFDQIRGIEVKQIFNGQHISLGEVLKSLGMQGAAPVGASFATNKPTTRKPAVCTREPWDVSDSGFEMVEVIQATDLDCSPLGLSDNNVVLGSHSEPSDRSRQILWTWTPDEPDVIDRLDLEPAQTYSGCINSGGLIAVIHGTSEHPIGIVFDNETESHYLEIPDGMGDPTLTAMNSDGSICGSLSITKDVSDGNRSRPAFWDPNGRIHVLVELAVGANGRGVDLTDDGVVLVWEIYGALGRAVTLWNPLEGSIEQVPGEIIPTARARTGEILGFDRRGGRDVAVLASDNQNWSNLPLNNGFIPTGMNDSLSIIGNVKMDGYNNGWLLQARESNPTLLPTFRYHNTLPRYINSSGFIAGKVLADNDQHVVLWTPVRLCRAEVRRVRPGPGLWPGPCRQARLGW
jgi:hypothetical protein